MNMTDRIPITTRDLDIPELISDVIDGDVDDNVASARHPGHIWS